MNNIFISFPHYSLPVQILLCLIRILNIGPHDLIFILLQTFTCACQHVCTHACGPEYTLLSALNVADVFMCLSLFK